MDTQNPVGTDDALSPSVQGSSIQPVYTVRHMRQLNIFEEELDHVSLLNSLSAWCFSAASGSALFAIGLLTNAAMQENVSQRAWGVLFVGVPIGVLGSVGFLLAACRALKTKGSRVGDMKLKAVNVVVGPSGADATPPAQSPQSTPDTVVSPPPPEP